MVRCMGALQQVWPAHLWLEVIALLALVWLSWAAARFLSHLRATSAPSCRALMLEIDELRRRHERQIAILKHDFAEHHRRVVSSFKDDIRLQQKLHQDDAAMMRARNHKFTSALCVEVDQLLADHRQAMAAINEGQPCEHILLAEVRGLREEVSKLRAQLTMVKVATSVNRGRTIALADASHRGHQLPCRTIRSWVDEGRDFAKQWGAVVEDEPTFTVGAEQEWVRRAEHREL